MSQSHVIDSWIAELKLSSRRLRSGEERVVRQTDAGFDRLPLGATAPAAASTRGAFAHRPRYSVISSRC